MCIFGIYIVKYAYVYTSSFQICYWVIFDRQIGIFDPPNMQIVQILVIGDPQMTSGVIWSQKMISEILTFFPKKIGIFEPPIMQILHILVMEDSPNDGRQLEQTSFFQIFGILAQNGHFYTLQI